jgi:ankyrin repeat protein
MFALEHNKSNTAGFLIDISKGVYVDLTDGRHIAFVNLQDKDGMTALMYAAKKGKFWAVTSLIETGGADASLKDKDGNTALDHASNAEIRKYLEERQKHTGASRIQRNAPSK